MRTTTFFSLVLVVVVETLASSSSFPDEDAHTRRSPILFQKRCFFVGDALDDEDARETRSVAAKEDAEEESEERDIWCFFFYLSLVCVCRFLYMRDDKNISQQRESCDDG